MSDQKMSAFHTYSPFRYLGFTEHNLSELEQILINFIKLPKTQALLKYYDTLDTHLNHDPTAHGYTIKPYAAYIVQQLYQAYLNQGYTGTVEDMLNSVIKDVKLATHADAVAGWDKVKVLLLKEWKFLLERHNQDPQSHPEIYALFRRQGPVSADPAWCLTYYVDPDSSIWETEGYTLLNWNQPQGTLVLSFNYEKALASPEQLYLVLEDSAHRQLQISIIDWMLLVSSGTKTYSLAHACGKKGSDTLVLTYDQEDLILHTTQAVIELTNPMPDFIPIVMYLKVPLGIDKNSIVDVTYYSFKTSKSEHNFFLSR